MSNGLGLSVLEVLGPRSELPLDEGERAARGLAQAKNSGRWRKISIFSTPTGMSDAEWEQVAEAGMKEAGALLRDWQDRRVRPWLYEPGRSDPTLWHILDKLNEMNRRRIGPPTQVALEHEARISTRQIQNKLKQYGLKWREVRGYRHLT